MTTDHPHTVGAFEKLREAFSAGMPDVHQPEVPLPKRDLMGRAYGTGRCKNAVARVWVRFGSGKFLVNREKALLQSDVPRRP